VPIQSTDGSENEEEIFGANRHIRLIEVFLKRRSVLFDELAKIETERISE
jgi:hypothetical protein